MRPEQLARVRALFGRWTVEISDSCLAGPQSAEDIVWQDESGPLVISKLKARGAGDYRLRLARDIAVDVHADGHLIAGSSSSSDTTSLEHFLVDQILPRVLARDGHLVVHAGGIQVGDGAILLMGTSGRGKSTLTASFDQAGIALLGDDAMIISSVDGTPHVRPVYPSLRLLPDSIAALIPGTVTAGPVAPYSSKERIDVAGDRDSGGTAIRVRAIFSIGDATASEISIHPLPPAQACITLVANSFALDPSDVDQARHRMQRASALAREVPAFEISYPRDYERLPEVRQAILDQVAMLEAA